MPDLSETYVPPWDWRIAYNHALFDEDGKPTFHAYDVNDNAACERMYGLVESMAEPNEGSHFCSKCHSAKRDMPEGRPRRWPVSTIPTTAQEGT